MKFNLNDFLQLDVNGLLAVNGGTSCSSSSSPSSSQSPSGPSNGPGSSPTNPGGNERTLIKSEKRSTGVWNYYSDGSADWIDNYGDLHSVVKVGGNEKGVGSNTGSGGNGTTSCGGGCGNYNTGTVGTHTISHGGGSCGVTTVGGSCSKTSDPKEPETPVSPTTIESGTFAQITDGSYADKLTMQYYVNNKAKYGVFTDFLDGSMNGKKELFSKKGCKMAAGAKIASEITGSEIGLYEVNTVWDTDKNGLLTKDEICKGLDNLLDDKFGDIYDVKASSIDNPTLKNLQSIADDTSGMTFVLGKAADVYGGEHWVVLEGYTANSDGTITFSYAGTSDNDAINNRSYVIGQSGKNIHKIVQIQTFTVYKK